MWYRVEERLPKDWSVVTAYDEKSGSMADSYCLGSNDWVLVPSESSWHPTHWRPKEWPDPPGRE